MAITFAARPVGAKTYFYYVRLFTIVEITVVLPVPAYPLRQKSCRYQFQLKNSDFLKKISLYVEQRKFFLKAIKQGVHLTYFNYKVGVSISKPIQISISITFSFITFYF
jgi:hypothetical protein